MTSIEDLIAHLAATPDSCEYLADIDRLRQRGLDEETCQALTNAGPASGRSIVDALLAATDEQIQSINRTDRQFRAWKRQQRRRA